MDRLKLVYLDEEILSRIPGSASRNDAAAAVNAELRDTYPIEFGLAETVTYADKTDRYVLKGGYGEKNKLNTVRVSNEVAAFLLQHAMGRMGARPYVRALMSPDGIVDAVALVFISR